MKPWECWQRLLHWDLKFPSSSLSMHKCQVWFLFQVITSLILLCVDLVRIYFYFQFVVIFTELILVDYTCIIFDALILVVLHCKFLQEKKNDNLIQHFTKDKDSQFGNPSPSRITQNNQGVWRILGKLICSPKANMVTCKSCNDAIASKEKLLRRH